MVGCAWVCGVRVCMCAVCVCVCVVWAGRCAACTVCVHPISVQPVCVCGKMVLIEIQPARSGLPKMQRKDIDTNVEQIAASWQHRMGFISR